MGQQNFICASTKQTLPRLKAKLLLVDEDIDDLLYYSAVLQHLGYEVRSQASYLQAASRLAVEDFDLVIVGQSSEDFSGRSVLARAVEDTRQTPILVLTRRSNPQSCTEALQWGAIEYLEKPLLRSEVAALVAKHLRPGVGAP